MPALRIACEGPATLGASNPQRDTLKAACRGCWASLRDSTRRDRVDKSFRAITEDTVFEIQQNHFSVARLAFSKAVAR